MSQEQPRKPTEPIKYGDAFQVAGELAARPVAPGDAAMMQAAETMVLGQTQKGGPAAVMQSAADKNESAGLVGHNEVTDIAGDQGITVTETDTPGQRIITESIAGQVVGQYVEPRSIVREVTPVEAATAMQQQAAITIGEALEASAQTAGNKPVEQSDAAAIQAAEARATGSSVVTPRGLAATAQSAASYNEGVIRDEDKVKLTDVLMDATAKLPADKAVTRQDAEGVVTAELRNNPTVAAYPGGVAASVAAAARLNEMSP